MTFKTRYAAPAKYRGRGCPSAFVGNRDYYGEWLAWMIDQYCPATTVVDRIRWYTL